MWVADAIPATDLFALVTTLYNWRWINFALNKFKNTFAWVV